LSYDYWQSQGHTAWGLQSANGRLSKAGTIKFELPASIFDDTFTNSADLDIEAELFPNKNASPVDEKVEYRPFVYTHFPVEPKFWYFHFANSRPIYLPPLITF
jgi:hypothetical protein